MYKLTLQNEQGNSITFNELNGPYTITDIDGLSPADANINLTDTALLDGQRYNSAKVNLRTMDIAFAIEYDAELNRLRMYDVLHVKRPITLFYKSDLRDVYIEGYVQKVHVTHFEKKQIATVTIICPSPFFKNAQEVINELTNTIKMFHFPFWGLTPKNIVFGEEQFLTNVTVENEGELITGFIVEFYASNNVSNPRVINYMTNEYIGILYDMIPGDLITINTLAGEKTVTLLRGGAEINLFNYVQDGSTWLQLEPGENTFVYEVGAGSPTNLTVTFRHYDLFEGV
jgi:hypothetical protein